MFLTHFGVTRLPNAVVYVRWDQRDLAEANSGGGMNLPLQRY